MPLLGKIFYSVKIYFYKHNAIALCGMPAYGPSLTL